MLLRISAFTLLLVAGACATGGSDEPIASRAQALCKESCDCSGNCSKADVDACVEDYDETESLAAQNGCDKDLKRYFGCIDGAECVDGEVDVTVCNAEWLVLSVCIHPGGTASSSGHPSSSSSSGSGGSGGCAKCGDVLSGIDAPLCTKSKAILDALMSCTCFENCYAECAGACGSGIDAASCNSCRSSYCGAYLDACLTDF